MSRKIFEYDVVESKLVDKQFKQKIKDCNFIVETYEYGILEHGCEFLRSRALLDWCGIEVSLFFNVHDMVCAEGSSDKQNNLIFNLDVSDIFYTELDFNNFDRSSFGIQHIKYSDICEAILYLFEDVRVYEALKKYVDFGVARSSRRM